MKPANVEEFFSRLAKQRPEPKIELDYVNPFTLLVAVVLSAQTTDKGVNKATAELFKKIKTPESMVAFGEDKLKASIHSIGFFNTKAKNVIALSKKLVEDFGGKIPKTREELMTLPGVGRKSANVVLNTAYGEPVIAVDTHIFRVANRTGLAHGETPDEIEEGLMKVVPAKWLQHAHHWLVLHGRYVCKAKKPDCPNCVVQDLCTFKDKTK